MNASEHRARARAALKGQWVMAALTTLVMMLATMGVSTVGSFLAVIPLIGWVISLALTAVSTVFSIGYYQYALNLVDHKPAEIKDIFSRFDLLIPNVKIFLLTILIFFVPMLIVGIVGGILTALLEALGALVLSVGMIALYVFLIMFGFGMSMVNFVLLENPGIGAREAMRKSWDLMNGHKFRFFCLGFSFIGWGFLTLFTFGIGVFAVMPYEYVAYASFYRELVPGVIRKEESYNPQPYEAPAAEENYSYNALPEAVEVSSEPKSDMDDSANGVPSDDAADDGAAVLTPSW